MHGGHIYTYIRENVHIHIHICIYVCMGVYLNHESHTHIRGGRLVYIMIKWVYMLHIYGHLYV